LAFQKSVRKKVKMAASPYGQGSGLQPALTVFFTLYHEFFLS